MVTELADGLLRDYRINGKKSLPDVEARWNLHLKPFFEGHRAIEVNRELLKRYVDHRQQEGASNATINRELAALKRMFNLAMDDRVSRVPIFPHLTERNVRTGFVEDSQYDKLAAACAREGLWMRALFEAGYHIGWRVSELLDLRVKQVDLLNRTVRLEPGTTKNREGRTAPINDSLCVWLTQCLLGKEPDEYVFSRDSLRPVRDFRATWYKVCCAAGVGKMVCPYCKHEVMAADDDKWQCDLCSRKWKHSDLKYTGLIFHDLRRTAVRNMTRDGIPERVAMQISGHKTRSVFDRYDIVSESDLKDAGRKMDAGNERRSSTVHSLGHSEVKQAPGVEGKTSDLPN